MTHELHNDWRDMLAAEFESPYYAELRAYLKDEYRTGSVYPPEADIFNALRATPYDSVKAVVLGQDPYHGPGQAHGLSFSVRPDVKLPPSLRNIYKELQDDLGIPAPNHGCLQAWAEQGVLLLNAVLTVREGEPNAHKGRGWERFTDAVVDALNRRAEPVAFVLWGSHAQAKGGGIDEGRHLVVRSPHPSPLSARRGFFGSRPFSAVNEWLRTRERAPIDWTIPNR
ncbi:uracil-DNA glycosylase [Paenibacillus sp. TRM 82003]|nr:uracil-DNA glycosylase [Paenibacillus sp. TRM 82003]